MKINHIYRLYWIWFLTEIRKLNNSKTDDYGTIISCRNVSTAPWSAGFFVSWKFYVLNGHTSYVWKCFIFPTHVFFFLSPRDKNPVIPSDTTNNVKVLPSYNNMVSSVEINSVGVLIWEDVLCYEQLAYDWNFWQK